MVRTQIYLTQSQQDALRHRSRQTGHSQSELIREAIDRFLAGAETLDYRASITSGAGLWRDRTDLPDFRAIRDEADGRYTARADQHDA